LTSESSLPLWCVKNLTSWIRLLPIGGGGNEERVSVGSITGRDRVHQHETTGHEQRHADFLLNGGNW
ncbi:unnamed protein product, partial [Ectocarpus sp. 13 AM-2016]